MDIDFKAVQGIYVIRAQQARVEKLLGGTCLHAAISVSI